MEKHNSKWAKNWQNTISDHDGLDLLINKILVMCRNIQMQRRVVFRQTTLIIFYAVSDFILGLFYLRVLGMLLHASFSASPDQNPGPILIPTSRGYTDKLNVIQWAAAAIDSLDHKDITSIGGGGRGPTAVRCPPEQRCRPGASSPRWHDSRDCVLSGHVGGREGIGTGRWWCHGSEGSATIERRGCNYGWIDYLIDVG